MDDRDSKKLPPAIWGVIPISEASPIYRFIVDIPWQALDLIDRTKAEFRDGNLVPPERFRGKEGISDWTVGAPPIPEWLLRIVAPDHRKELRKARDEIEGRAPKEYSRRRLDMYRLLAGDLVRSSDPWNRRHWRALRKRAPHDQSDRDAWLSVLFNLIWTCQCLSETDQIAQERIDQSVGDYPSRREIQRLLQAGPAVELLLRAAAPDRRASLLAIPIRHFGEGSYIRLGDLVGDPPALQPGSGPRPGFYSATELLMGYFTAALSLPTATAARLTSDILQWDLGADRSWDSIRQWWTQRGELRAGAVRS